MKNRKNIIVILSGLLIFQILLFIVLNFFSSQSIKLRGIEKKLLTGVKKENVSSIEISDSKDTFLIEKKDDNWFVKIKENYIPGNATKIYSYINILLELTQGVIRDKGTTPEADKLYGFEEESYQKVTVKAKNDKSYTIIIGNTGSQRGTSYIRFDKEKKVREVNSIIAAETGNLPINWAKTNIFEIEMLDDIARCEIDSNLNWFKGSYSIKKIKGTDDKKTEYIIEPSLTEKKLKEYALENIITGVLNLTIDDYKLNGDISQKEKKATVKLILTDNETFTIDIYPADKDDISEYILDVSINDYLYLVKENEIKKFIKAKTELVE